MKKSIIIIVCMIFFSIFTSLNFIETSKASGNTLYVGSGQTYPNIQDAIDAASEGDTVYVYSGTYFENINITKSINLEGENKDTTIIDAGGHHDCILVLADSVSINGFTIQNSGNKGYYFSSEEPEPTGHKGYLYWDCGIQIYHNFSNIKISNNKIQNTKYGIKISGNSSNITIESNSLLNNTEVALYPLGSNNNTISKNIFLNNKQNIYLLYSEHNIFSENNFGNTTGFHNIYFAYSSNNTFQKNTIKDSKHGIFLDCNGNNNNIIFSNTISNNNNYGIYIRGKEEHTPSSASPSVNNIIVGNNISNNKCGIGISSEDNILYQNNFIDNKYNANDSGKNTWNSIEFNKGNYWDDYNEEDNDGDGIGDISYEIYEFNGIFKNNTDPYPLIKTCNNAILPEHINTNEINNDDNINENKDDNKGIPGFELIISLSAMIIILLWRKRKDYS